MSLVRKMNFRKGWAEKGRRIPLLSRETQQYLCLRQVFSDRNQYKGRGIKMRFLLPEMASRITGESLMHGLCCDVPHALEL